MRTEETHPSDPSQSEQVQAGDNPQVPVSRRCPRCHRNNRRYRCAVCNPPGRVRKGIVSVVTGIFLSFVSLPLLTQEDWIPVTCNSIVQGELKEQRHYYPNQNVYTLEVPVNRRVTVTLRSEVFDSYVLIYPQRPGPQGQDDDSAGGTDARLVYDVKTKGGLFIVAAGYSKGTEPQALGAYTLQVECGEIPPPVVTPPPVNPPPGTCTPDPSIKGTVRGTVAVTGKVIAARRVGDNAQIDIHPGDGTLWTVLCSRGRRTLGQCVGRKPGDIVTVQGAVTVVGMRLRIEP